MAEPHLEMLMPSAQTPRTSRSPWEVAMQRTAVVGNTFLERKSSRLGPPPEKLKKYFVVKKADPYLGTYMENPIVGHEVMELTASPEVDDDFINSQDSSSQASTSTAGHIMVSMSPRSQALMKVPANPLESRSPFQAWLRILLCIFQRAYGYEVVAYEGTGVIVVTHIMKYIRASKKWDKKVEMFTMRCYSVEDARKAYSRSNSVNEAKLCSMYKPDINLYKVGEQWLTTYFNALHTGLGWDERNGVRSPAPHVWGAVAVGYQIKFCRWVPLSTTSQSAGLHDLDFEGKRYNLMSKVDWDIEYDCGAIEEILSMIDDAHWI